MFFDQLVKLVNAGFTKEDITAFLKATASTENAPEPAPAPAPAPVPAPPASGEFLAQMQTIAEQMKETAQQIQMANIRTAGNVERSQEQIADDFLASIINPKK